MLININDFETLSVKLTFKGGVFRNLKGISFMLKDSEYAVIIIDESLNKQKGEFELVIVNGESVKLIKKDKLGLEFDILENEKKWLHVTINKAILNYSPYKSYKSAHSEIKFKETGYGYMFYKDDKFIGIIRSESKLFSLQPNYFIDAIDKVLLNFLVAMCTVEILQKYFFKISSLGE